jgi:hypothetical protein
VNEKRVRRLMRKMGIAALYQKPRLSQPGPGPSDLPVFAEKPGNYAGKSGLEHRHHIHPVNSRVRLSGGDYGLVQPLRVELGSVDHFERPGRIFRVL